MNTIRSWQRLLAASLWLAAGGAAAQVPTAALPWSWLGAFAAPAALLGLRLHRHRGDRRWWTGCAALQVLAVAAAWQVGPAPTPPAGLLGAIVPPLAFVAARRRLGDGELGLFLAFCLLFVGVILGGIVWPALLGFGLGAGLLLRATARLQVLAVAAALPPAPRRHSGPLAAAFAVAAMTGLIAFLLEQSLQLVPRPKSAPAMDRAENASIRQGLSDEFEPPAGGAGLERQRGAPLAYVAATDDDDVPADLYLRSGYFDLPGLDRWRTAPAPLPPPAPRDTQSRPMVTRPALPDVPLRRLTVSRLASAGNLVFAPPGLTTLGGLADLVADLPAEFYRQTGPARAETYAITFQDLRQSMLGRPIDERADPRLLALPADLDLPRLRQLLAVLLPDDPAPVRVPALLVAALRQRCRYSLAGPRGPDGVLLYDFLFGTARQGSCMHFAMALATLLRVQGVPCRIGVGLCGGERDGDDDRTRIYGENDAHAWVEVPFVGVGFVVFDATPPLLQRFLGGDGATVRPSELAAGPAATADAPDAAAPPTPGPALLAVLPPWLRRPLQSPWPWALLLLAAVLTGLRPVRLLPTDPPLSSAQRPARRLLLRLLRQLADAGRARPTGATLEQYRATLAGTGLDATTVACVGDAFAAYQEVRFGGHAFDAARRARLQAGLRAAAALRRTGT